MVGLVALAALAMPTAAAAQRAPDGGARIPGCTIVGTPRADVLVGGPGDDIICGLGGNDRLFGGGGDDVLRGGPGADRLQGGSGDDVLRGDEGADELRGGSGNDEVYAGPGDDDAQGGEGNDTIWGGTGDDDLGGGPGRDTIRAVDGPDFRDVVGCGSGEHDRAFADTRDDVSENCESNSQNTAPHAVDDSYTTTEDTTLSLPASGAGSPAANDTDAEGDLLSVVSVAGSAGGTVSLAAGTITFAPTPNLCGPAAGHFDYTVSDGHGGTDVGHVTVAITCTPDDPTAADDLAMVPEDAPATSLAVLGNDHDPDGDPLVIASATDPAHGTVAVTGGGTGLTYAPDANYCNAPPGTAPDTFTYTLTPGGSTATVTVLVLCADDAPVAVDDTATVAQDAGATAIDVLANDTDIDGGPKTVASATDPAHGTVAVTGGGTGLTYAPDPGYCNNPPGTTPDTFTYTLAPGGSSATVSVTVTCPDTPPTAVNDSATVLEDASATAVDVLGNDTDTDGGPKTVASVTQPANGTVVITGGGTGLTYAPAANYCNNPPGTTLDTFTYTLNGGSTGTVTMTVTCVDDAPTAVGDAASVTEDASATAIDVLANDTDVDGGPKSVASVTQPANGTVVITGGGTGLTYAPDANYCNNPPGSAPDTFTYTLTPGGSTATVSVTVDCAADAPVVTTTSTPLGYTENDPAVVVDPTVTVTDADSATLTSASVAITAGFQAGQDVLALSGSHAPISASYNATTGVLTLSGSDTPAAYQAALRDVTYVNSSDAPSTATRTVTFTATDDSALSGSATRGITVTAVDDAPTAVNDSATVLEDATATAVGVLGNDTDVDGGPKTVGSVTQPANGTVVITGGGTGLTYAPAANYCNNPPGTTLDTFTYTLNGGSTGTVTMTVTCVNDAPADLGETQAATGNTRLEVEVTSGGSTNPTRTSATGNLLDNATDVDDPHSALTVDTSSVSDPAHGTVVPNADGSYVYTPDVGYTGPDSFTYQVTDGKDASTPHTVDITVANRTWYVRADAAPGGDGRSESPFDTLTAADTAANATGDTIYVFRKSGDAGTVSDSSVDLLANQSLIGSAVDLTDGSDLLYDGSTALRPSLTGTSVNLASGNVVRGLSLAASGTPALVGGAGDNSGTLDQLVVSGNAGGLSLNGTTGTFDVSDLTLSTTGGTAVALTNAGSVVFAPASPISITAAGGPGLVASGTGFGTSAFDDITVTGSGSGAVSMTSTTGSTTFGNLALTTTSGATGAFVLSSAGTVTVASGGTATVSATGGPAVDVTGTSGATLPFDSVSSAGSAGDGVNLSGLGTGTFSASAGSITNAGGIDVDLDGGSGAVSYDGTITDDVGQLVRVQNTTGGTKDFNGAITDGNDGDGSGIALAANTGATIRFDGGLTLSTGANTAFSATGGGTLAIPDPAGSPVNTIATTTGTALNVVSTTIHADGLVFQSIAANGAPNGIVLNATGGTGGLSVTGTGTAGSGGTIQNTTSDALALTSTGSVNLSRMNVTGSQESGILGSAVAGLDLTGVSITNNGNDSADDGIRVANLTGSNTWSSVTVSGSARNNVFVDNSSGTLAGLTVTGTSHFDSVGASFGSNAFLVQARGTAVITSGLVDGATFANNYPARGLTVQSQETGRIGDSSTNAFVVQNSSFTNNGLQASFEQSGSADLTFKLLNNSPMTMPNTATGTSHAVNVFSSSTSTGGTIRGRIAGNAIGSAGTAGSGSAIGDGIRGLIQGKTVATLLIANNTIRQVPQGRGIDLQFLGPLDASGVAGNQDVTVTNNDVNPQDSTGFPLSAIYVAADSQGGGTVTTRADIRGNTVPAGASFDALPTFLVLDKVAAAAVCQLVNTTGSGTPTAQLTATNTGSASAQAGCTLISGPIGTPP